jgi:hypothetical protein
MKGKTTTAQRPKRAQKTASPPIVPLRTALFGGAALLILFAWLHLILALQIASTGRQIQIATEELQRLKRDNMALVRDTAIAESEEQMAERAAALGYGPQAPVYLSLGQTLTTTGSAIGSSDTQDGARLVADYGQVSTLSRFLLDPTLYDTTTAHGPAQESEASSVRRGP